MLIINANPRKVGRLDAYGTAGFGDVHVSVHFYA